MAPQIAIELAQDLANKPRSPINIDPLSLIAREEKLQRNIFKTVQVSMNFNCSFVHECMESFFVNTV